MPVVVRKTTGEKCSRDDGVSLTCAESLGASKPTLEYITGGGEKIKLNATGS